MWQKKKEKPGISEKHNGGKMKSPKEIVIIAIINSILQNWQWIILYPYPGVAWVQKAILSPAVKSAIMNYRFSSNKVPLSVTACWQVSPANVASHLPGYFAWDWKSVNNRQEWKWSICLGMVWMCVLGVWLTCKCWRSSSWMLDTILNTCNVEQSNMCLISNQEYQ